MFRPEFLTSAAGYAISSQPPYVKSTRMSATLRGRAGAVSSAAPVESHVRRKV